ncbi:30S ribosomal protein S16 [Nesterenkonia sp.]|uniref:30S ribosomal protein S16 n=1 Tax=Nesterenkonia sp. TaxID=704201 RepID=UPI00260AD797|nr:30S ribosomal protein S16 [Nesterenkonia sp.]
MAVKIRLKRMGKIRSPHYRVVVADSRAKRDGKNIEEIGKYHPTQEPSFIEINSERAQYWLSVGAQPTEQVLALLKITGDWQKFKGIDGAEGTLKTKAPAEEFVAPSKGSVIQEKTEKKPAEEPAEAAEAAEETPAEDSEEKAEA